MEFGSHGPPALRSHLWAQRPWGASAVDSEPGTGCDELCDEWWGTVKRGRGRFTAQSSSPGINQSGIQTGKKSHSWRELKKGHWQP